MDLQGFCKLQLIHRGEGAASIEVDFKNVPRGVKTTADMDSGVFKTLKIRRSPQAPKAGAGVEGFTPWAVE